MDRSSPLLLGVLVLLAGATAPSQAGVITYGDKDVLGTASYPVEPTTGATLQGLAPNVVTFGAPEVNHGFPFVPSGSDFPGTDQIFVGSVQTGFHDGYSVSSRLNGPQVLTLDYSSLVPAGHRIDTLTLGVAADDFQFPVFGQPFTATLNGQAAPVLTTVLNSLDQTGPQVQFFSIGVSTALLTSDHKLILSINQGGDGGDGWAVDFLTVGVTTSPAGVPEPGTVALLGLGVLGLAGSRWRRGRAS